MSVTSVVVQVKQALIDRMGDSDDLNDVDVAWLVPGDWSRECIYFAGATTSTDVNVLGGDSTFDDTVVLTLVVDCTAPGLDAQAADQRCDDLFSAVKVTLFDSIEVLSPRNVVGHADIATITTTSGRNPSEEGWTGVTVATLTFEVLLDD